MDQAWALAQPAALLFGMFLFVLGMVSIAIAEKKEKAHPAGYKSGSGWYAGGASLLFIAVLWLIGLWMAYSGLTTGVAVYVGSVGSATIGLLVGLTELLARYKDEPTRAMRTGSGLLYMALNASASLVALLVLIAVKPRWLFGDECNPCEMQEFGLTTWLKLVAVSGLGAAALFRSSLAKIKTGEGNSAIGPAVILDTILTTTDRAVDRRMAGPRGDRVTEIMEGISFDRAKDVLPAYCFSLMQNVSPDEAQRVSTNINALESARFPDRVRALVLGLHLMSVVGYDVFRAAVEKTRELMHEEWSDDAPIVKIIAQSRQLDPSALCLVLTPYVLSLKSKLSSSNRLAVFAAVNAIERTEQPASSKNVGIILKLLESAEPEAIAFALKQLGSDLTTQSASSAQQHGAPGGSSSKSEELVSVEQTVPENKIAATGEKH